MLINRQMICERDWQRATLAPAAAARRYSGLLGSGIKLARRENDDGAAQ